MKDSGYDWTDYDWNEKDPFEVELLGYGCIVLMLYLHFFMIFIRWQPIFYPPGEEASPKIQHNCNTGNNLPISLPPYHMTSFKKELDKLLVNGIIEECESSYASPFSYVLVPKLIETTHLCIDYWKLNAIPYTDNCLFPRMDDFLQNMMQNY
ncbi:reverse transcriptase [Caerostris extrusa]|uniref:Reverse transcriptase n=1 Tax=Caerostris extrusa TaxID=172846 RepID=A0AAV4N276_CAEEX|nr:reverse transcriptase [Caerostris extrusa]